MTAALPRAAVVVWRIGGPGLQGALEAAARATSACAETEFEFDRRVPRELETSGWRLGAVAHRAELRSRDIAGLLEYLRHGCSAPGAQRPSARIAADQCGWNCRTGAERGVHAQRFRLAGFDDIAQGRAAQWTHLEPLWLK